MPERRPALPEESQSRRPRVPAQAPSWENDAEDLVELSFTDGEGRKRTWSFRGVDRASRALCRPILSCGLVVALILVAAVCILAHSSTQEKVICGLGSAVVTGLVWIGSQAKRWAKSRWQERRDKVPAKDEGRG
jgi:hypothetical protein